MKPSKLSALLGVDDKPVQWERPLLLFLALFVWNARRLIVLSDYQGGPETGLKFLFMMSNPIEWGCEIVLALATAYAAMLCFRLIRSALGLIPFTILMTFASYLILVLFWSGWSLKGSQFLSFILNGFCWNLAIFGCLEIALRILRKPFTGILAGSVVGTAVASILVRFLTFVFLDQTIPISRMSIVVLMNLGDAVVFSVVLWGALRFCIGRPEILTRSTPPRISRAYFTGAFLTATVCWGLYGAPVLFRFGDPIRSDHGFSLAPGIGSIFFSAAEMERFLIGVLVIGAIQAAAFIRFVYCMWSALRDRGARMTPGAAVQGLILPFYNLYWVFQVFPGFATDFNRHAERNGLTARVNPWWLMAYPCVTMLSLLLLPTVVRPAIFLYVFMPMLLLQPIIQVVLASKVSNAVNALPPVGGAGTAGSTGAEAMHNRAAASHVAGDPIQEG